MPEARHGDPPAILVAEDEALVRNVAVEALRDAGFNVFEAPDGNAAFEFLRRDIPVDLLISDIKMPGMNGYQLAEAGTALRPDLKVLLITGFAQEPVPEHIRKAGIEVLYKPFDVDELVDFAHRTLAA